MKQHGTAHSDIYTQLLVTPKYIQCTIIVYTISIDWAWYYISPFNNIEIVTIIPLINKMFTSSNLHSHTQTIWPLGF